MVGARSGLVGVMTSILLLKFFLDKMKTVKKKIGTELEVGVGAAKGKM